MQRFQFQTPEAPPRTIGATVALLVLAVALLSDTRSAHAQVPDLPKQLPEGYDVMPFENRSGILGLEWMRLALPFVVGERAEGIAKLRPLYGDLVVTGPPRDKQEVDASAVARHAQETGARWVFTGWVKRPDWKLQLGISLFRVDSGIAKRVGEVVGQGEFKDVHRLVSQALTKLNEKAGLVSKKDDLALLGRESTSDFYAFTLFGRGLGAMLNARTKADWEKSRKTLERAVFIDPSLSEGQRVLASLYLQIGQPLLAKGRLEFALKGRPEYAAAIASLARSARARHQDRQAREFFEKALGLRPWDLENRYELGVLYWEAGQVDEAFAQLSMVAAADPKHIKTRRALVQIHASRSDTSNLVRELEIVVQLAPRDVPTLLDLGAALVAAKRFDDAIGIYEKVVEIQEKNVQALKFIGDLHKRQGQESRAIRYYGLAIKAAPNDPRAYFLLGATYVAAGDDAAARRIYLKAQRFAKFRAEAFNNLGAIEFRREKVNQSLWYLRRAVKLKPKKVRYRYNLALSLSATKETEEALVEVEAALALDPDHLDSNYLKGVVLLRRGQAQAAREAFQKTLSLKPTHGDAKHNLALLDEMKRRATEGEVVVEGK